MDAEAKLQRIKSLTPSVSVQPSTVIDIDRFYFILVHFIVIENDIGLFQTLLF